MAALRVWELKRGIHDVPWIDLDQREPLYPMIDDF